MKKPDYRCYYGENMQLHGSYELFNKGQILVIKAFGAWNYETAFEFGAEYMRHACDLRQKPWACLLDLTEWELFTPEASDYIDELNKWSNVNNQKFEVVVSNSSIQKFLLEKNQQALTNVETKFCDELEHAYQWLENVGVIQKEQKPFPPTD